MHWQLTRGTVQVRSVRAWLRDEMQRRELAAARLQAASLRLGAATLARRSWYSVCLFYWWYKSTNTDAEGAGLGGSRHTVLWRVCSAWCAGTGMY